MKALKKTASLILVFLLVCGLFASCGAGEMDVATDMMPQAEGYYVNNASPTGFSLYSEKIAEKEFSEEVSDSAPAASAYAEKIIKNVNMSTETKEFDKSLDFIRTTLAKLGGFEESIHITRRDSYYNTYTKDSFSRYATMTLRVPAEKLDDFLSAIGSSVNVISESSNATNVTSEYYDILSRISVLETEKEAYQQMMEKATEIKDLLTIKERLYDVIAEIESYETRIKLYDSKVSFSTVTLTLSEVVDYTVIPKVEDSFGKRLGDRFRESWKNFAEGWREFVLFLVGAFPTLLILAAIATGIVFIVRVGAKKRKLRMQKYQSKKPDQEQDSEQ